MRKLSNTFLFEFDNKIAKLAGATEAREMVVNMALEYLDSLAQEASGDADLQLELAQAYLKVAKVQGDTRQGNLGQTDAALASYRKAIIDFKKKNFRIETRRGEQKLAQGEALGTGKLETQAPAGQWH